MRGHFLIRSIVFFLVCILGASWFVACQSGVSPKNNKNTLILNYSDFGPQAAAHELIGFEWYQWESHGDSNPNTKYDVKVVVYRNTRLNKVKEMYPVIKGKQDYRYVHYRDALEYCDRLIKEEGDLLPHLVHTRDKIIKGFGK